MYFEYPGLLWLLAIPAALVVHYIYLELAQRHPHLRVSSSVPWTVTGTSFMAVLRHLPFLLRTFALVMIVIAIARPRSSTEMERIDTEGIDIVLAMDVSTSMLARDLTPDRINASKDIAIEFISQRPSDRMGIVVFAGESFTQCPLTTDRATLINLMKEIQQETGMGFIFIAHDLSMVKYLSDRIGVLHLGHIVETGTSEEIFSNPIHPYTRSLLSANPSPNPRVEKTRQVMHYDYATSGIDYLKGKLRNVGGMHQVLSTEEELARWTRA